MFYLPSHRRNFLSALGGGMGWLASHLLLADDQQASKPWRVQLDPLQPHAPRRPPKAPKAKSVIVLFMVGGPSSIDTFDYKPTLQKLHGQPIPTSIRDSLKGTKFADVLHGTKDELMASPFAWRQVGRDGMWMSELFPHLAEQVDRLCFLHSLQADSNNHAPASYQLHTGDVRAGKASLGSWVTYGLGSENQDLPSYVVLFDTGPLGGAANYSNGFLPAAFQPTHLRSQGSPVLDLIPPSELAAHQRSTIDLIQTLNQEHRQPRVGFTDLDARIASYELAYRMQASALEVGDLDSETLATHHAYGLDHPDPRTQSFARKCLLSRRLVERGVRFVQLYDMPDKDGWDAHEHLVKNHTPRARWTDQPVAALLADLNQRGLLDETLVVWMSEFGRTPTVQGKEGRQHNAAGFTIWMAGAGVQPGRIGATDPFGVKAIDRPIPFRDLHATLLNALGLNHEDLYYEVNGRQERLTGVAGSAKPIHEVFGGVT